MYESKTLIDADGYIVKHKILIKNGKPLFVHGNERHNMVNYCNKNYIKPHWNGTEWEEKATNEEIAAKNAELASTRNKLTDTKELNDLKERLDTIESNPGSGSPDVSAELESLKNKILQIEQNYLKKGCTWNEIEGTES